MRRLKAQRVQRLRGMTKSRIPWPFLLPPGVGDNIDRAYSEPISSAHKTLDCLLDLQDGLIENNSAISEALDTELTCVELFQPPCIRRCIGLLIVILKQGMERVRRTFYHQ